VQRIRRKLFQLYGVLQDRMQDGALTPDRVGAGRLAVEPERDRIERKPYGFGLVQVGQVQGCRFEPSDGLDDLQGRIRPLARREEGELAEGRPQSVRVGTARAILGQRWQDGGQCVRHAVSGLRRHVRPLHFDVCAHEVEDGPGALGLEHGEG